MPGCPAMVRPMIEDGELPRDLAALVVPLVGGLMETGDRYEPYKLAGVDGVAVEAVTAYFVTSWRRGGRSPRFVLTGWICCAGSGSCGPPRSPGIGRLVLRLAIFPGGCEWLASSRVRTGGARSRPPRPVKPPWGSAACAVGSCAQRDSAAGLLRLSPERGHRADHQSVPAALFPPWRTASCASRSDVAT